MNRSLPPGCCGTGVIIQDTGGITGTGTTITYHGTAVIIRHIIFIMPEGGMKADTIIMPPDRHAAEIAAAVMIAAADGAAAETGAADAATVVAADAINYQ